MKAPMGRTGYWEKDENENMKERKKDENTAIRGRERQIFLHFQLAAIFEQNSYVAELFFISRGAPDSGEWQILFRW